MSKPALRKYLSALKKKELEAQIIDLYDRFKAVKTYYDFVFNPKEDKLLQEAKSKILNEYFPLKRKRAKARRSIAKNYIKHFQSLGMDPYILAELMVFNLETAQRYAKSNRINEVFCKSMLRSFIDTLNHLVLHGMHTEFKSRIQQYFLELTLQQWDYQDEFQRQIEIMEMN